ncbi:MAG: hypothetical protein HZA53_11095 [Planctomycetes bacterium]|nr:hypothetical protein [Planctomycetota bacterium]
MVDQPSDFPTPEQLAARFRIVRQLYDLGIALREARFVDRKPAGESTRGSDRVHDVQPEWKAEPDGPSGDRPVQ